MLDRLSANQAGYERFSAPEDIVFEPALSLSERKQLLREWKADLKRQRAAMAEKASIAKIPLLNSRSGPVRGPEELLRRVNACRRLLADNG